MLLNQEHIEQHISSFDSFILDEIHQIKITFDYNKDFPETNVFLEAGYPTIQDKYYISFSLLGVRQLKLPELGGEWFQFGELEIQDIKSAGLENLNYSIFNHLEGLSCYCQEIVFLKLQKLTNNDKKLTLWEASNVT